MKIFWMDVETTGLDNQSSAIVELSYIIVGEDGEVLKENQLFMKPHLGALISDEALKVIGKTKEEIMEFPEAVDQYHKLIDNLGRFIDKYDREDKLVIAGHNVRFDMGFLRAFFVRLNDQYFGSWFKNEWIDTMQMAMLLKMLGLSMPDNFKLTTLCSHYNIDLEAHEAINDIRATKSLMNTMYNQLIEWRK